MIFVRKFLKRLFANKYIDLFVIVIVFFSILLLIFESISGFIITKKTIENLTPVIDENKLGALETLEDKRFAQEELINILENTWVELHQEMPLYDIDDNIRNLLEEIIINKNLKTAVTEPNSLENTDIVRQAVKEKLKDRLKSLDTLKNMKFSKEELKGKLKDLDFTHMEIIRVLIHCPKKIENLKDKLVPDKFKFIKALQNKKILKEELKKELDSAGFNNNEIDIVFNHSSGFVFNKNEIKIILDASKLIFPISLKTKDSLIEVDDIIITFFILELLLRYFSYLNYKDFFSRHWLDIIAVIPLFRVFRLSRVFLLLRLFRVFSFAVIFGRHLSFFAFTFHKRWIDFLLILIFLVFTITFGTLGLTSVEVRRHPSSEHALWSTVFTLFSGQYIDDFPDTLIGKLTVLLVIIAGMSCFAILIGTVSAIMVEKFKEGIIMKKFHFDLLENHIIICGWQEKTPQIIKELHSYDDYRKTNIVVISDREDFLSLDLERMGIKTDLIYLMQGDFTDPDILRKANLDTAKIAIILPDRSSGRSNRDMDARTVLTALTIEKLNHDVYSCAELLDPEYESHMKIGNVNQVILGGYYSGLIAAHAAINENLVPFINNILPSEAENKFQNIPLPEEMIDNEFGIVIEEFRRKRHILPVGVKTSNGELLINPQNYIMKKGDYLIGLVNRSK